MSTSLTIAEPVGFLHAGQECLYRTNTPQVLEHIYSQLLLKDGGTIGATHHTSSSSSSRIISSPDKSAVASSSSSSSIVQLQAVVFEAGRITSLLLHPPSSSNQVQLQLHNPSHLLYFDSKHVTGRGRLTTGRSVTVELDSICPLERASFSAESVVGASGGGRSIAENSITASDSDLLDLLRDKIEVDQLVVVPFFGQEWEQRSSRSSVAGQYFLLARMFSINHCPNGYLEITVSVPLFDSYVNLQSEKDMIAAAKKFVQFEFKVPPEMITSRNDTTHAVYASAGVYDHLDFIHSSVDYGRYLVKYPYFFPILTERNPPAEVKDMELFQNSLGIRSVAHVLHYSDSIERLLGLEVRLEECVDMFETMKAVLLSLFRRRAEMVEAHRANSSGHGGSEFSGIYSNSSNNNDDGRNSNNSKNSSSSISGGGSKINSSFALNISMYTREVDITNQILRRFKVITKFLFLTLELYRRYNSSNIIRSDSNRAMIDANKQIASRICDFIKSMVLDICELQRHLPSIVSSTASVSLRAAMIAFASFVDCTGLYRGCLKIQSQYTMTLNKDPASAEVVSMTLSRAREFCEDIAEAFEDRLSVTCMVDIERQQWDSTSFYRRDCYITTGLLATSILLRKHLFYISSCLNLAASSSASSSPTDVEIGSEHRTHVEAIRRDFYLLMIQSYLQKLFEVYSAIEVSRIRHSQFVIDLLHIITTTIWSVEAIEGIGIGMPISDSNSNPNNNDEWIGLNALLLHFICLLFIRSATDVDLLIAALSDAVSKFESAVEPTNESGNASAIANHPSIADFMAIRKLVRYEEYFKGPFDKLVATASRDENGDRSAMGHSYVYNSLREHQILGGKTSVDSSSGEKSLIDLYKSYPGLWTTSLASSMSTSSTDAADNIDVASSSSMFRLLRKVDDSSKDAMVKYFVVQIQQRCEFIGVSHYKRGGPSRSSLDSSGSSCSSSTNDDYIPNEASFADKFDFPKLDESALEAKRKLETFVVSLTS